MVRTCGAALALHAPDAPRRAASLRCAPCLTLSARRARESSGTEDYFLSASYFDEGTFASSQAGLTWKNSVGSGDLSMYKTHTRDLVPFHGGMQYMWRNNENGQSCPNHASPTRADRARSPKCALACVRARARLRARSPACALACVRALASARAHVHLCFSSLSLPASPAPPHARAAQWPGSVAEAREAPAPRKQAGLGERTQEMNLTSITMFYAWPSQA